MEDNYTINLRLQYINVGGGSYAEVDDRRLSLSLALSSVGGGGDATMQRILRMAGVAFGGWP